MEREGWRGELLAFFEKMRYSTISRKTNEKLTGQEHRGRRTEKKRRSRAEHRGTEEEHHRGFVRSTEAPTRPRNTAGPPKTEGTSDNQQEGRGPEPRERSEDGSKGPEPRNRAEDLSRPRNWGAPPRFRAEHRSSTRNGAPPRVSCRAPKKQHKEPQRPRNGTAEHRRGREMVSCGAPKKQHKELPRPRNQKFLCCILLRWHRPEQKSYYLN